MPRLDLIANSRTRTRTHAHTHTHTHTHTHARTHAHAARTRTQTHAHTHADARPARAHLRGPARVDESLTAARDRMRPAAPDTNDPLVH